MNKVLNIDCYEYMKTLPDKFFDIVVTDPPYGINVVNKNGQIGNSNKKLKYRNIYKPIINDDIKLDLSELFRVSKNQIIFGGNYFNLSISKGWIVWDKKCQNDWDDNFSDGEMAWTSFDRPLKIYRQLYMGFVQKGKREIRCHPTQKSVNLMKWIIKNYTKETDVIFDPFAGSGSTLVASKQLNRKYIGCELDKNYFDITTKRLKEIDNTEHNFFNSNT